VCPPPLNFLTVSLRKRLKRCTVESELEQEDATMRIILKIIAIPVVIVLTLFVWICSGLLYCSAFVLGLAGTVLGVLGILVMITSSVTNGIIVLVMAFLVSPFGIPMAAAWLLGILQGANYALRDFIRT